MLITSKKYLLFILLFPFLSGCKQHAMLTGGNVKNTSHCILLGYDSMAYYYGNSSEMQELKQGNIYNHVFTSYVIKSIRLHSKSVGFKIAFKPTAAGDVAANTEALVDLFNTNGIQNRYMDTLDANEKKFFNTISLPRVANQTFKLSLPADPSDKKKPLVDTGKNVVKLLCTDNFIYAYQGRNIAGGEKYTYNPIGTFLQKQERILGKGLIVVVKPNDQSTYQNFIDIMDEIKKDNIEKYALTDITKDEDIYVKQLK